MERPLAESGSRPPQPEPGPSVARQQQPGASRVNCEYVPRKPIRQPDLGDGADTADHAAIPSDHPPSDTTAPPLYNHGYGYGLGIQTVHPFPGTTYPQYPPNPGTPTPTPAPGAYRTYNPQLQTATGAETSYGWQQGDAASARHASYSESNAPRPFVGQPHNGPYPPYDRASSGSGGTALGDSTGQGELYGGDDVSDLSAGVIPRQVQGYPVPMPQQALYSDPSLGAFWEASPSTSTLTSAAFPDSSKLPDAPAPEPIHPAPPARLSLPQPIAPLASIPEGEKTSISDEAESEGTAASGSVVSREEVKRGKRRMQNRAAQRAFRSRNKVDNQLAADHTRQLEELSEQQTADIVNLTARLGQADAEIAYLRNENAALLRNLYRPNTLPGDRRQGE